MLPTRHTSEAIIPFPDETVGTLPKDREIHFTCDNLSAHKTKTAQA